MTQLLVVCWGMGQDSTGMRVGMWERGMKPELIITADVGSERPEKVTQAQLIYFRPDLLISEICPTRTLLSSK
jgi:hypothetical protein